MLMKPVSYTHLDVYKRQVTTKSGNYFYILMDRAAEGEQTVHFLKQVDEADLMALTENGEAAKKPEICNCTEKCEAGKVNTSCPV